MPNQARKKANRNCKYKHFITTTLPFDNPIRQVWIHSTCLKRNEVDFRRNMKDRNDPKNSI